MITATRQKYWCSGDSEERSSAERAEEGPRDGICLTLTPQQEFHKPGGERNSRWKQQQT